MTSARSPDPGGGSSSTRWPRPTGARSSAGPGRRAASTRHRCGPRWTQGGGATSSGITAPPTWCTTRLRKHLGTHVRQQGSLVEAGRLRFDFSHHGPIEPDLLDRIEREVNELVLGKRGRSRRARWPMRTRSGSARWRSSRTSTATRCGWSRWGPRSSCAAGPTCAAPAGWGCSGSSARGASPPACAGSRPSPGRAPTRNWTSSRAASRRSPGCSRPSPTMSPGGWSN